MASSWYWTSCRYFIKKKKCNLPTTKKSAECLCFSVITAVKVVSYDKLELRLLLLKWNNLGIAIMDSCVHVCSLSTQ